MANLTRINYQNKEFILIGTAHVSSASALEVCQTIDEEQPDTICIELDQSRYDSLTNPDRWKEQDIVQIVKQKKVSYLLVNLILASYQNRLAKAENIVSGQEMMEGIRLAKELNATLILADRDVKTTFMRIYRQLSLWEKCKLIATVIVSVFDTSEIPIEDIERMKDQDMLNQALDEIAKEFPQIKKTLVDERDQYLAYKIQSAPGSKIVAILGAAHIPGIKERLTSPQSIEGLDDLPPAGKLGKIFGWLIPVTIVSMIAVSYYLNPKLGWDVLLSWILWNGSFAAFGSLLMLAHPLTILTSFALAPLTTLTPVVGVGWFSAMVEAILVKPQVKDFESISTDTQNTKGFFKNRVTRILLIFVVTNIFSSIATFVGGFNIFSSILKHL